MAVRLDARKCESNQFLAVIAIIDRCVKNRVNITVLIPWNWDTQLRRHVGFPDYLTVELDYSKVIAGT